MRSGTVRLLGSFAICYLTACLATQPLGREDETASANDPETAMDSKAWTCDGLTGKTTSPAGAYDLTSFGCWRDAQGSHGDPGDNCLPACYGKPGYAALCDKKSGPDCERALNYYVADADRFGCFTRLRITNPANGKRVIAVVLDRGPHCAVESKVKTWVLDASTPVALHLFGEAQGVVDQAKVRVEPVPSDTPLGPEDDAAENTTGASGNMGDGGAGGANGTELSSGSGVGGAAAPILIDNDNTANGPGTNFTASGAWIESSNVAGYQGNGYRWRSVGPTSDPAKFEFLLDQAHSVKVEARWSAASDRSAAAPYLMFDAKDALLGKVFVNQRKQGGTWVTLGEFPFSAGWNTVALSRSTPETGVVIADAVRVTSLDN